MINNIMYILYMGKTKKNYNNIGGKVIASGGYGCVFEPALKCEGQTKRHKNTITKLMTNKHAVEEYEEINFIKEKLDKIPNYNNYYLLNNVTICRPAELTDTDLKMFSDKCKALPKNNITKKNVNQKLESIMALNLPNGGLPVDDFIYDNGNYKKLYKIHNALVNLLKKGIIPMNKKNIYHSDIKDSNILIEEDESILKARLIDWGLTVNYNPHANEKFPKNWRNRPIQFNVPFSVVIFSDLFYDKYSKYLEEGGEIKKAPLRPFVTNYINEWFKYRGLGHYKFINEIMYKLYSHNLTSVSESNKPLLIETEITLPYIIDYIIDVLLHFTKFKSDGSLNLREYLNEVYVKIVDIWGFITVYYPFLEIFSNNYSNLNEKELKVFKQIKFIFNEYLFTPRHEPINMDNLFSDLNLLGKLIHILAYNKKKTTIFHSSKVLARGIKTRKKFNNRSETKMFERKPLVKRFNKPFFLSLK
jgi:serine/threonine protein kinase